MQLVLQSRRFTCLDGLRGQRSRDCSSCFVFSKSAQWCRVDSGVKIVLTTRFHQDGNELEPIEMYFLRVVKYPVLVCAVIGKQLSVLDGNEETLTMTELIPVEDVVCTGIACPKPLHDTAIQDEQKRVVVPSLYL